MHRSCHHEQVRTEPNNPPNHLAWWRGSVAALLVCLLVAGCRGSDSPTTELRSTNAPSSATSSTAGGSGSLVVPAGIPNAIDGTLEPEEWDDALVTVVDDGSKLYWQEGDGYLFVAIEATDIGAMNLAVAGGDGVSILHSSAALGSASYGRADGQWELIRDFTWCCRTSSEASERTELFEREGWQASIGFAGVPGQVEYQVVWPDLETALAVSYVSPDGTVAFWPADLSEEARDQLHGSREDTEIFRTEEWVSVIRT